MFGSAQTRFQHRSTLAPVAAVRPHLNRRHPATGVSLGSRDAFAGVVTLTQVENQFNIGTFAGNGVLRRGDILKLK